MTNRELLNKICTYDLLCRINDGILIISDGRRCICGAFSKRALNMNECLDISCEKCIADWLNEETKLVINERRQK